MKPKKNIKKHVRFTNTRFKKIEFSRAIESISNLIINKNKILTLSFNPGKRVYDENTISIKNQEYREWDPNKSKLCAAIFNGLNNISLNDNMNILYLGSSTGTTVSHLSDININGKIFALDFAPRVHRELLFLAKDRKNIFPLMADVTQPLTYFSAIEQADLIFQDIAQKDQLTPFVNNIKLYLKKNGIAIISVKARSIDVVKRPSDIFKDFTLNLGKYVNIMEKRLLDPYEKDHCLFVVKQKK